MMRVASMAGAMTGSMAMVAPAAVAGPIETAVETGDVALLVRADRSSLTTAETLTLRLEATAPTGARVQWPDFDDRLGEFTIIDRLGLPPRRAADGRRTVVRTLTLSPFLPGEYEIPPLDVTFTRASGEMLALRSQPMTIEVTTLLDEEPGELSVGEPAAAAEVPEEEGPRDLWPLAAGAAGVAIVFAAGAAVAIARRARRERPPEDPVRAARLGLASLATKLEAGSEAPSPVTIDDLARPALSRLLGSHAAGATSAELLDAARRLVPAETLASVARYLSHADEALFSGRAADSGRLLREGSAAVESLVAWRRDLREGAAREGPPEGGAPS